MSQKEDVKGTEKICLFCERFNEIKSYHGYSETERPGRSGTTESRYRVALVHETYYNGEYCGHTVYDTGPLYYCPVCGRKVESQIEDSRKSTAYKSNYSKRLAK